MAGNTEEIIESPPAVEVIGTSMLYGFTFGSGFGLLRGIWQQKPSMNPQMKALPVPYAQIAQNCGSLGMTFAFVSAIYTGGACAASGIRGKDDSLNYGVGGAGVGVFLGLRAKSLHQVCLKAIALGALGTACSYGSKMIVNPPFDSKKQYNGMYAYMPQAEGK